MPNGSLLLGFIAAALVVLVIPGPGVMYVVARSLGQGTRAGLASVLGLSCGVFVHVAAAAGGLSAILLASATAFTIVKFLGAGYLIYLGIRTIFARTLKASLEVPKAQTLYRLFCDGVIISIFNPKIAVFFLAFLPQFVDPAMGSVPQQVLLLGFIYVALAILTDGSYALLAGSLRHWFQWPVLQGPLPRYVCGSLYIGLGVKTAFTGRQV